MIYSVIGPKDNKHPSGAGKSQTSKVERRRLHSEAFYIRRANLRIKDMINKADLRGGIGLAQSNQQLPVQETPVVEENLPVFYLDISNLSDTTENDSE